MGHYKFEDIVYNIIDKKMPQPGDEKTYVGLEHLDSGSLSVTRWGSDVEITGQKLVMRKEDVLFGRRNTYLRRAAIAPHDGIFSAHGMIFRPKTNVVDADFFPFFIASDYFIDEAIRISVGSLSPTVNWGTLKNLEFDLPSIEKQKEMAKLLVAANDAKEAYKKLLILTDDLVKSQFIEIFGDPVNNPKGWPLMTMRDASTRLSDGPFGSNLKSEHYRETGVRVIRLQNIGVNEFIDKDKAYVSEEHYTKIRKYTCYAGDIVIGTLGEPNLRACLVPDSVPFAINKADCVHFVPRCDLFSSVFVCHYINYPTTLTLALGKIHGNTRQRISSGQVAQLPIYVPPLDLQNEFTTFAQQIDKSKFELQQTLDNLENMIRSLLYSCLS